MKHIICVLIVFLGCVLGRAQQAPNPGPADHPRAKAGEPSGGQTERPPYALLPGAVQLGGRIGSSYLASGIGQAQPAAGGEIVVGLPHNLAFFGEGTWHSGVDLGVLDLRLGTDLFDLGTGIEWNIPNRTRVVPYVRGGVGLVHVSGRASFLRHRFSVSGSNFAFNAGGGLRVHLTQNYGFLFDFRAFDGPDFPWMVRPSVGFFFRFK